MYSEENMSAEDVRKLVKELIPGGRLITPKSIHHEGDYRCYVIVPKGNGWEYLHRANKLFELANILTDPRLDINKSSIRRGLLDHRPFPMSTKIKCAQLQLLDPRLGTRERREWKTELKELRGEM